MLIHMTQKSLEDLLIAAYTQHNQFIVAEDNAIGFTDEVKQFREKHLTLNAADCAFLAQYLFQHFTKPISSLQISLVPVYLKKGVGGLSNSVVIFYKHSTLNILIKPRINYKDPATRVLTKEGGFKVIKPYGLCIELKEIESGEIQCRTRPIIFWSRTKEDMKKAEEAAIPTLPFEYLVATAPNPLTPALTAFRAATIREAGVKLKREQKLTFLQDPNHLLQQDVKKFRRVDYDTPDGKKTILYQEYLGITMFDLRNSHLEQCHYDEKKFSTDNIKFKAELIFSFLHSVKKIIENGEWPNDIKFENTCVLFGSSIKCSLIDYICPVSTDSLFKTIFDANAYMSMTRYTKLLGFLRTHQFNEFRGEYSYRWEDMRHELIFELFLVILLIMGWPFIVNILSAQWNQPLDYREWSMNTNKIYIVKFYQNAGQISQKSGKINLTMWDCPITRGFIHFLNLINPERQPRGSQHFMGFLNFVRTISYRGEPAGPLPWPAEFDDKWISDFAHAVDNFLSPGKRKREED